MGCNRKRRYIRTGMHIKVKVWAGVGKEKVKKVSDDRYEVYVKEPAQAGMANKRVQQALAETLSVPVHKLRLVSGFQRPQKIFEILG